MKLFPLLLTAGLGLVVGRSAIAQPTILTQPLASWTNFRDPVASVQLGIAGYYQSQFWPWDTMQWGSPQALQPAAGAASGWAIGNPYMRVQYYPMLYGVSNVYELAQANNYCNHEMDLFLQKEPTNGFAQSAPINAVGSIRVKVGLAIPYVQINNNCAPLGYWDYSQYIYSVILSSTTGQTLFYQVNLGKSVTPPLNTGVGWCPTYEQRNDGYDYQNRFCLDDDIRNFGGVWVTTASNVVNNIEILPRILEILAMHHTKQYFPTVMVDPNPANWRITTVYAGQIIQGGAVATSHWYGLQTSTMPGGQFCNGSNTIQWSCNAGQPEGGGWVDVGGGCYHRNSGKQCFAL